MSPIAYFFPAQLYVTFSLFSSLVNVAVENIEGHRQV